MVLESKVEGKLKVLEGYGFKVLKLKTPAYNGVMDRMILAPIWSPAPPSFVELKRPTKRERLLQSKVRDNWRERGVDVRDMCDTLEKVDYLVRNLVYEAEQRAPHYSIPWERMPTKPE